MGERSKKKTKKINPVDMTEMEGDTPEHETLAYKVMEEMLMQNLKGNKVTGYPEILEHL
jgi:hypothetical protein